MRGVHVFAVVVSSFLVGLVVVYVLPFGQNLLNKIQQPTVRSILDNKLVQILTIGLITAVGIGVFTSIARSVGVEKA